MPNYKGHIVGGVAAFVVTGVCMKMVCTPSPLTLIEWFLFTIAGSLFPDVDIKSKGQRYAYWIILGVLAILFFKKRFAMMVGISILAMTPMISRHRGLFHRAWFLILFSMLIWYLIACEFPAIACPFWYDMVFFVVGAFSHLCLDKGIRRMWQW